MGAGFYSINKIYNYKVGGWVVMNYSLASGPPHHSPTHTNTGIHCSANTGRPQQMPLLSLQTRDSLLLPLSGYQHYLSIPGCICTGGWSKEVSQFYTASKTLTDIYRAEFSLLSFLSTFLPLPLTHALFTILSVY